jgi:protease-4
MAPQPRSSAGRIVLVLLLLASIGLNIFLLCGGFLLRSLVPAESTTVALYERFAAGAEAAHDKVAVIRIDGTIIEGQLGFVNKQIEQAALDSSVKAAVIRIESPGGTISASDDLHRKLSHLRDGTTPKLQGRSAPRKPLVVSMGAIAASGGYYIAMPASAGRTPSTKKIFADRTTITGSIGVFAAFPNVEGLAAKHGVSLELIKAGAVKGSGSLFYRMTPQERQPWADMVNNAYSQFIAIVETGRPDLQGKLTEDLFPPKTIPVVDERGNPRKDDRGEIMTTTYTRQRADGGVFTADEALQWGLVDAISPLDDVIAEAARQAGLSNYRAITYDRPISLLSMLIGSQTNAPLDWNRLAATTIPRLWYLAPGSELSALSQALGQP